MRHRLGNLRFGFVLAVQAICALLALSLLSAAGMPHGWQSVEQAGGSLVDVSVGLSNDTVGVESNLTLHFGLLGEQLPPQSTLQLAFPPEFDKSGIDSVTYTDSDEENTDYTVTDFGAVDDVVSIELDTLGTPPEAGSRISVTIYGLGNAESAIGYRLAVAIVDSTSAWLTVPVWTPLFYLQPGPVTVFTLDPSGVISIDAGDVIHFEVGAEDFYGNTIDLPSDSITWTLLQSPPGVHPVVDGKFEAKIAGSYRLQASYHGFSPQCNIYVLPGPFAQLRLSGGSAGAGAGIAWEDGDDDVVVSAHDIFGNLITDFEGDVYFTSTDGSATLPATQGAPFTFTVDDQGKHSFTGSEFTFFHAGSQDLYLWYDGKKEGTLSSINVTAGPLADFQLIIPSLTTAGASFMVDVANAVDAYDNPVTAIAAIELVGTDGASPSGVLPSLDDFVVTAGEGSGSVTLVDVGLSLLRVSLDSHADSGTIEVTPAPLDRFTFELESKQVPKQPFRGPALLTAFDLYGNVIIDYSAASDPVTITASGNGVVTNGNISSTEAFIDGVCDLTQLGVGYNGEELTVVFTATSSSGKTGVSPLVEYARAIITDGGATRDSLFGSESYELKLTITNYGTETLHVETVQFFANDLAPSNAVLAPTLPLDIPGTSYQIFTLTGSASGIPAGEINWSAAFQGTLSGTPVGDSMPSIATMTVLGQEGVAIVSGTLSPTQVSVDRSYTYSIQITNNSVSDLNLTRQTTLELLSRGLSVTSCQLQSATVVKVGDTESLIFEPGVIAGPTSVDISQAKLNLVGTLGGVDYSESLEDAAELVAQSLPDIQYQATTLAPDILYRGQAAEFSLSVTNVGEATLGHVSGELRLYAGDRSLVTNLNAPADFRIATGDKLLDFTAAFVPADFPKDIDSIVVVLQGDANNYSESARLYIPVDEVTVPSGPAVSLTSVKNNSPNAPFVNLGQRFTLSATIANQGDEDLRNIALQITSDGGSSFESDMTIPLLSLAAETTVVITIDAALTSTSSEVFTTRLVSAEGVSSGLAATLEAPTSNNQFVVIQRPANLSLSANISSPQEAQDGVIKPGVEFEISALVENDGQSDVGSGELSLTLNNADFSSTDPLTQSFEIDQPVSWHINSPAQPATGSFDVDISTIPTDANIDLPARVTQPSASLNMDVRDVEVSMSVDFQTLATPLIAAGGSYDVLTFNFDVLGEESPYLNYLNIYLHDRNGANIDPNRVIAHSTLTVNNSESANGLVQSDTKALRFILGPNFDTPKEASLSLTVADNPQLQDFVLYLDSTSFSAAYLSPSGVKDVPVTAAFATKLVIEQSFTLVPNQLDEAFFCYPNPFSPRREALTFTNPMPERAKTLVIYALTGEEVYRREIAASESSEISWDGSNDSGHQVLNGVYLAIMTIPGEGEVRTKVAVVK